MRRYLLGLPVVALLVLAVFALTPCIAQCGDAAETVTVAVRACPRAVELLGSDAKPARLGMACGSTKVGGNHGTASWTLPYSGARARGSVSYSAEKRGGEWHLEEATLEVDGETIDLVACSRKTSPPGGPATLAQTNADAATATFDGKVLRSTHPTIPVGATCRGELVRERGSPSAHVKVSCDPGTAEASGATVLYEGTGNFMLDVRDPARRDDDHSEYDDAKTSDVDRTPGCRVSGSGGKGTLTIWDSSPAYELVVEL